MSNIIPFESSTNLPAHLRQFTTDANEFGFSGVGYPSISLKGKVFTIDRNGEKALITRPDDPEAPAPSLEVVILGVGPKGGKYAKTFYAGGYVEGSKAKPTCYSDDGDAPALDAAEPQSKKCALCPQNAKGSGATSQNANAKACRSTKRLAVAPAGQLNDPMLLRVPGDSLMALSEYGDALAKRKVRSSAVVTRIGFDYTVAHPKLTFKPVGFVTPEMVPQITEQTASDLVKAITGEKALASTELKDDGEATGPASTETLTPVAPKVAQEKPATRAVAKEQPTVVTDGGLDAALSAINFDD